MRSIRHKSLTNRQYIQVMALEKGPVEMLVRVDTKDDADRINRRLDEIAEGHEHDREDYGEARIGDWWIDETYPDAEYEFAGRSMHSAIADMAGNWGFDPESKDTWEVAGVMLDGKGRVRRYEDGEVGGVVTRSMR